MDESKSMLSLLDTDLPPINRTEANMWKALYFEMRNEVIKANKGIKKLRQKLDRLEDDEFMAKF